MRLWRAGESALKGLHHVDFVAPLLLRLYLAPIFIYAGFNKAAHFQSTVEWFGHPDWGLGLPMPMLLAGLAISAEVVGGLCLLVGLATRFMTVPLMVTMVVAAVTVHWSNGWSALPDATLVMPWEWRADLIDQAIERREAARQLLQQYGQYDWLTAAGPITVLKNGIEYAATYFIMLLSLLMTGPGRWVSVDFWLQRLGRRRYGLSTAGAYDQQ